MRTLVLLVFLALVGCSTEHELTPLQSAAMRCKPSNIQRGDWPCQRVRDVSDEPMYCYRGLAGVDCYAEPRPNQSAETRRQTFPPEVTDPRPYGSR